MKNIIRSLLVVGFLAAMNPVHAQTDYSPPQFGTFFLQSYGAIPAPFPYDPYGGSEPMVQLTNGAWLILDTPEDFQAMQSFNSEMSSSGRMSTMSSMDGLSPGDGGGGGSGDGLNFPQWSPPTNYVLWLEITNVSNGTAYLNLHNASNYVYEIFSKTNLADSTWDIASEVFPADTNCQPFNLQPSTFNPQLFLWARDWTGITSGGNTLPEWWLWLYYGTVNLSDSDLDSNGNTLLYDYQNNITPVVFQFTAIEVANNYVNSSFAAVQLDVSGSPYYIAVSVDDTNYAADANWQTYTGTNVTVNLGTTEGWHDVWIGLRGHGDNSSTAVWRYERLKLDLTPPKLSITSPTNNVVDVPMIQLQGFSPEALGSISYDLSNAVVVVTNQQVLVLDQFYDTNTFEFTTNTFQAFDVDLTNGLNVLTIHATDLAGNTTTTNFSFTLDYSSKTNPPVVQITWPQNGTQISGTNFTLDGQVDDPTAKVAASITDAAGDTNVVYGAVERNGKFWVEEIPLNAGTNNLVLTMTDAVGNSSVTNISVVQTSITLTMDDVTPDSQLWQATVNLTGKISDSTYAVWVNGVKGHNNGDGTWSANNVPVNKGGTASFTMTGYAPNEQQPDGSYGN